MRRKLICTLVLLLILMLGLALLMQPRAIDFNAYQTIKPGMSRAEVEKLMGGPPGDYTRGRYSAGVIRRNFPNFPPTGWQMWTGSNGCFMIQFDEDGNVL